MSTLPTPLSSWSLGRDGEVYRVTARFPPPPALLRAPYAKADLVCATCARPFRGRADRLHCSRVCWAVAADA